MSDLRHPGRRRLMGIAAASTGIAAGAVAIVVARTGRASDYEAAVRSTWQSPAQGQSGPVRNLVHAATLAANSHNTQPWQFLIDGNQLEIAPDWSRRCPAVDPDDHHLFVSLGCALENIMQAAHAAGIDAVPSYDPGAGGSVHITLGPAAPQPSPLADAISFRQSTRANFDGKPLLTGELNSLAAAGEEGVDLLLLTARPAMETVLSAVIAGNTAQVNDPAYVKELRHWLRFSYADALGTNDGLFSGCTGNPVVPGLIGRGLFRLFYTADSENHKYAEQVRSSSGIAVIASAASDKAGWISAGRVFQRLALTATAMGVKLSLLNSPIEVAAIRPQFASAIGLGTRRPDMIVRFGRGPTMTKSLRRPVAHVLTGMT